MADLKIKKLLADRIMINPETLEQSTKAGILLPANLNAEKQGIGRIMMLGEKVYHAHEDEKLVVGQRVLYGKMAGMEMEYLGEKVKMLRATDIFAIFEEEDKK